MVIASLFILVLLAGVLVIALILRRKHYATSLEEELAKDLITQIQQQASQRRHSNWSPAVSKRRRREAKKMRDQNYIDWQKTKMMCVMNGLDYDKLVFHMRKIASKYGMKLN